MLTYLLLVLPVRMNASPNSLQLFVSQMFLLNLSVFKIGYQENQERHNIYTIIQ